MAGEQTPVTGKAPNLYSSCIVAAVPNKKKRQRVGPKVPARIVPNLPAIGGMFISMPNMDLHGTKWNHAEMQGADLHGADLRYAGLEDADLSFSDLSGAKLAFCNLRNCDLSSAELALADLHGARLCGAMLDGADLYACDFRNADLQAVSLTGADLRDADLTGANLRDVLYDRETAWPESFNPAAHGAILVDDCGDCLVYESAA